MTVNPPPLDMNVGFHATAFPPNTVSNSGQLTFNANDLAHALFTTGRTPGDRARYGAASAYEWLHRTSLIPAYIRRAHPSARLTRSKLALDLDRSEKTSLSYALGQAMTAIFCERKLATAYLMHVDRYANHFKISFGTTRRRADLFGCAPRGWVVAEAKGRSGGIESDLQGKMVAQKRSVRDINGSQPWVALACVAHFPRQARYMHISAFDPDEDDIETISLRVSMDSLMLAYYSPFVRAIEIGDAEEDQFMVMASFGGLGLHVGLLHNLRERIYNAESGELEGLHEDALRILDDTPGTALQRTDGTTVITDWNEMMNLNDRDAFFDTDRP